MDPTVRAAVLAVIVCLAFASCSGSHHDATTTYSASTSHSQRSHLR